MKLLATLCDNPIGPAIDASYDLARQQGVSFTENVYLQLLFHACAPCLTVDVRNIVDWPAWQSMRCAAAPPATFVRSDVSARCGRWTIS